MMLKRRRWRRRRRRYMGRGVGVKEGKKEGEVQNKMTWAYYLNQIVMISIPLVTYSLLLSKEVVPPHHPILPRPP